MNGAAKGLVADSKGRRFDASTGILAVVLWIVGFGLPGAPPKADATNPQIGDFLVNHRSDILASTLLICLGSLVFLWWLGSLRSYLRSAEGGEGRLSAAAFGGGIAGVALLVAGICVLNGAAFDVAREFNEAAINRALFDVSSFLLAAAAVGFTVTLGAASCSAARSGSLPPWLYWLGSVGAVAQLVTLVSL